MNRRSFLQKTLIIPGLGAGALWAGMPGKLFAGMATPSFFSISVLSDKPGQAIPMIQDLFNRTPDFPKNMHYTEYIMAGSHMADIVYTQSGRLIDFYALDNPFSSRLRKIAKDLNLPRVCKDPVLCHFSLDQGIQSPKSYRVFKDNTLILEKAFTEKQHTVELDGAIGSLVLEASADHSLRFVKTSCRHKTCMTMGKINQAGQNLICVPNRITVAIAGQPVSAVDSITF